MDVGGRVQVNNGLGILFDWSQVQDVGFSYELEVRCDVDNWIEEEGE